MGLLLYFFNYLSMQCHVQLHAKHTKAYNLISDLWLCRRHLEITTSYLMNKFGVLQEEVAVLKSRASLAQISV